MSCDGLLSLSRAVVARESRGSSIHISTQFIIDLFSKLRTNSELKLLFLNITKFTFPNAAFSSVYIVDIFRLNSMI